MNPLVGPIFGAPLSYLFFLLSSQLWAPGSAHHPRENVNDLPPGGATAGGPGVPTINMKTSTAGPQEVPEMKVREHPPST
jgi:hypothetical protein